MKKIVLLRDSTLLLENDAGRYRAVLTELHRIYTGFADAYRKLAAAVKRRGYPQSPLGECPGHRTPGSLFRARTLYPDLRPDEENIDSARRPQIATASALHQPHTSTQYLSVVTREPRPRFDMFRLDEEGISNKSLQSEITAAAPSVLIYAVNPSSRHRRLFRLPESPLDWVCCPERLVNLESHLHFFRQVYSPMYGVCSIRTPKIFGC